jgi:hypothetical protein
MSLLSAAVSLGVNELLRLSSDEARQRVFAPRVTRRLAARNAQARATFVFFVRVRSPRHAA